jgi:hypothetical protein
MFECIKAYKVWMSGCSMVAKIDSYYSYFVPSVVDACRNMYRGLIDRFSNNDVELEDARKR